jgi:hypothetical protein
MSEQDHVTTKKGRREANEELLAGALILAELDPTIWMGLDLANDVYQDAEAVQEALLDYEIAKGNFVHELIRYAAFPFLPANLQDAVEKWAEKERRRRAPQLRVLKV